MLCRTWLLLAAVVVVKLLLQQPQLQAVAVRVGY
jgi:hypothetical protein